MNQSLAFFRSSPGKLITSVIVIGTPILCLSIVHSRLSRLVHHATQKGTLTAKETSNIDSIPEHELKEQCFMVHDIASKPIPKDLLPPLDTHALLTAYLRYTMVRFSNFPQAWILRLIGDRGTFQRRHLQTLDFREGDVVNGLYRVVLRQDDKVEFLLKQGSVEGRLVVGMRDQDEEMVFYSETVMWKRKDDRTVMPLERVLPKWLHELASWSLLEAGTKFLAGLRKGS